MITDGEKWHYLAAKSLSALFRGIASNNNGDFYCLNCFHLFRTENKLKKHKNVCENHDYCYVEMPKEDNKILKYNHGEKFMKAPFIIYTDLESLLEKMNTCHNNNTKKSSTAKINKHTPFGYLFFTHSLFHKTISLIRNFCLDLKEHATKIINYEKKEMIPLRKEEKKIYRVQKVCYICKKRFSTDKKYHKVKDHCYFTEKYRGAAHNIYNLRCKTPKEILVVFDHGSTYDYHFIIKDLAEEFEGQFECLGENTEKYMTFSVPIKKELDNTKSITYKIKFLIALDLVKLIIKSC